MRFVAFLLIALALASCATGPATAPPPEQSASLAVCAMRVTNAPATDSAGRIRGFDPNVQISGAYLLRAPVAACVSSGYGPRRGGAGSFHHGVDLYTGSPRAFVAGGDGVIEFVGTQRGYGRTVLIRHNENVKTRYAHLSSYADGVRKGRRIRRGETLGKTGRTGNATAVHLHYEILVRGRPVDPLTAGK